MNKKFINSVEKACEKALVDRGFERPRKNTIFYRLDEDFLGWVGLNQGNFNDHLQINPFIGIHCIPVMKLIMDLKDERYQIGRYASYAFHFGEVAPDITQFIFTEDTDLEEEAERLAEELTVHGLQSMKVLANYEVLRTRLKDKVEMLGGYPERYVAVLYMMGLIGQARNFIDEKTDIFDPDYSGPYSLYEKFGKPFLEMLEKEKTKKNCRAR